MVFGSMALISIYIKNFRKFAWPVSFVLLLMMVKLVLVGAFNNIHFEPIYSRTPNYIWINENESGTNCRFADTNGDSVQNREIFSRSILMGKNARAKHYGYWKRARYSRPYYKLSCRDWSDKITKKQKTNSL